MSINITLIYIIISRHKWWEMVKMVVNGIGLGGAGPTFSSRPISMLLCFFSIIFITIIQFYYIGLLFMVAGLENDENYDN